MMSPPVINKQVGDTLTLRSTLHAVLSWNRLGRPPDRFARNAGTEVTWILQRG
jgi:hypothetical protein